VQDPPPLPPALSRPGLIALIGSVAWTLVTITVLVVSLTTGRPLDLLFTTCLTGTAVGGLGYGIYRWQRAAARRGSRTAQDGLD
jgi:hypothetical protein